MNNNLDALTTELAELFNKKQVAILIAAQVDENDQNHIRTKFSGSLVQIIQLASASVMLLADQLSQQFNLDKEAAIQLAVESITDQLKTSSTKR